jgi:hypothetical protein
MSEESKEPALENRPGPPDPVTQPPIRVCPTCSAQSQTLDDTCPHCGSSFIRSRRLRAKKRVESLSKWQRILVGGVLIGVLAGGIAAGVIAKVDHDNRIAQEHKEEREERELAQHKKAQEERVAEEELETEEELERIEARYGRDIVEELETAITKDANGEAEEGIGEYASETSCEAEGGKVDTGLTAQNFSCLAITSEEEGLQESYRYSATINYAKGRYTWRLGGP